MVLPSVQRPDEARRGDTFASCRPTRPSVDPTSRIRDQAQAQARAGHGRQRPGWQAPGVIANADATRAPNVGAHRDHVCAIHGCLVRPGQGGKAYATGSPSKRNLTSHLRIRIAKTGGVSASATPKAPVKFRPSGPGPSSGPSRVKVDRMSLSGAHTSRRGLSSTTLPDPSAPPLGVPSTSATLRASCSRLNGLPRRCTPSSSRP